MSNKAILCVDDESIILLALTQELKNVFGNSFLYEKAISAELAFQIIDELVEDGIELVLIISDWLMPGIKGDEFLELISDRQPGIKAIMITGQADAEAVERAKCNDNVKAILRKPWSPEELVAIIRTHCDIEP